MDIMVKANGAYGQQLTSFKLPFSTCVSDDEIFVLSPISDVSTYKFPSFVGLVLHKRLELYDVWLSLGVLFVPINVVLVSLA